MSYFFHSKLLLDNYASFTFTFDWGVVCLLIAYCWSNSPLARAMGSRLRRGTTASANQLPLLKL